MKRFISTLVLLAMLAPATGFAQDTRDPGGRDGGGQDYDLSDYVLGRGEFAGEPSSAGSDHPSEDIISDACEGEYILIFADDGSIEDWDCA